jgi:hypothetical protein
MPPIGPNGPGNPYNPTNSPYIPISKALVPIRATQPLARPATRSLSRPVGRTNRTGRTRGGNVDVDLQTGEVENDLEMRIDPTNVFRRRSRAPGEDTVTLSEYMSAYIDRKRLQRALKVWAAHWCALFSWEAQSIKAYINFAFGKDKPQYVEARIYGYFVGGGF